LISKLEKYQKLEKVNYKSGQISGCVYKLVKSDMTEINNKISSLFGETNPLHVDVFPDIRTMEAEVVRCVATMFHGDINVCGTVNYFNYFTS
jgi:glutamate/tyrosine decarboxylase-like PLP-dependent enzyme